ncbi:thioesterase family protein [Lederbergia citrea]|uniref:Thioesterase n=1 Tax=Lederbergia citrea TaxID=2833581 RepID=A0A942Z3Y3_9BACI|nr:thioesterase [Lederbergia citrea]MBS4177565.1 thioesterase [Lederbergia citrea]MBS4204239.1 thioesterase [Lederbergia citrea]MBS4221176.1 thioesterase [Lederbergia citrea]
MKPGIQVGQSASISFKVTPDMFAQFEGNLVHEAYSTVSMVYHMEWVSRQIILPFLENHEEGIGGAINLKHIAPTAACTNVTVKATLIKSKNNIVITKTEAWNDIGLIGVGEVTQMILPKKDIKEKLAKSAIIDE